MERVLNVKELEFYKYTSQQRISPYPLSVSTSQPSVLYNSFPLHVVKVQKVERCQLLVSGRTMDYRPFRFMDKYDTLLKLNGGVDGTLIWRQLYCIKVKYLLPSSLKSKDYKSIFQLLFGKESDRYSPFYEPLTSGIR